MIWQKKVLEGFKDLNLELSNSLKGGGVLIILPKYPDNETLEELKSIVPYKVEILEGVKYDTVNQIDFLFSVGGCEVTKEITGRNISYVVTGDVENEQLLWDAVSKEIIKDGYFNTWSFTHEGRTSSFDRYIIQALSSHKVTGMSLDETDLKIALEISQDVNDFLALLEGEHFNRR